MNNRITYFEKIARAFSRNYGITVKFEGSGASYDIDNSVVRIPVTVDTLDRELRKVYEGLLDHEALGHAFAETDCVERGVEAPSSIMKRRMFEDHSSTWMFVFNAIEDARIERRAISKWPGTEINLRHCAEWALSKAKEGFDNDPNQVSPWWLIGCGVFAYARGMENLIEWFPAEGHELLQGDLAPEVELTKRAINPVDCEQIVDRIFEKVDIKGREEKNDQGDSKSGEEGEGAQESQGQQAEDGQGQDSESDSSPGMDEKGTESASEGSEGDSEGEGEGEGETSESGDSSDSEREGSEDGPGSGSNDVRTVGGGFMSELQDHLDDWIKSEGFHHDAMREIESLAEKLHVEDLTRVSAPEIVRAEDRVRRSQFLGQSRVASWETWKSGTSKVVGGLSQRIAALLRTRTERSRNDQDRGRIDSRNLVGLKVGNRDIFRQNRKAVDVDTVVSILVDMSGSMAGHKAVSAATTAFALGEALDRAGVPFELRGFHTNAKSKVIEKWERVRPVTQGGPIHNRWEPLVEEEIKTFSDSWKRRSRFCVNLAYDTGGCNNDPASLEQAANRLLVQPQTRKIVFILSDGQPVDKAFSAVRGIAFRERGQQLLKAKIEQLEKAGIEIAAIGIGTDYVEGIYQNSEVVDDVSELSSKAVKLLKRLVVDGRRRAA